MLYSFPNMQIVKLIMNLLIQNISFHLYEQNITNVVYNQISIQMRHLQVFSSLCKKNMHFILILIIEFNWQWSFRYQFYHLYAFYYDLYDALSAFHSDVTTVSFIIV